MGAGGLRSVEAHWHRRQRAGIDWLSVAEPTPKARSNARCKPAPCCLLPAARFVPRRLASAINAWHLSTAGLGPLWVSTRSNLMLGAKLNPPLHSLRCTADLIPWLRVYYLARQFLSIRATRPQMPCHLQDGAQHLTHDSGAMPCQPPRDSGHFLAQVRSRGIGSHTVVELD